MLLFPDLSPKQPQQRGSGEAHSLISGEGLRTKSELQHFLVGGRKEGHSRQRKKCQYLYSINCQQGVPTELLGRGQKHETQGKNDCKVTKKGSSLRMREEIGPFSCHLLKALLSADGEIKGKLLNLEGSWVVESLL